MRLHGNRAIARVSVDAMKHFTFLFVLALAGTAAAGSYNNNKKTVTHDCAKDPDAAIEGNENTITFTGTCTLISVDGNENKLKVEAVKSLSLRGNKNAVTVDAADAIDAPGNDNKVTWTKGISDKRPKVSSSGNHNKIGASK
jgi:hypothetical protein